ncbi:cadmium resistance transporter [Vulcanococcus limneticus]|uniref:cadmium resistance transporter n=1 Tax=Vulcanococcus limneticus TaxID=2170428 RepID=UPI00398BD0F4
MTGWLGAVPILMGVRNLVSLWQARDSSDSEERDYRKRFAAYHGFRSRRVGLLEVLRDRKIYSVSAVTISNGGNNLAIYIPLFTSNPLGQLALIVPICYLAVLTWLFLSYRLTRLPGIAVVLSRYANHVFPFVLMWLGFRILNDSGALALLGKAA